MLKLAIKDIKEFEVLDFEIKRKKISYTIGTLRALKQKDLKLIINYDLLSTFHLWKDFKEILKIASLVVGTTEEIKRYKGKNFFLNSKNFIQTKAIEISSTMIRQRLKKGLYVGHLLPKEVMDYIYKSQIYFSLIK